MAHINLLPWREERRERKNKEFLTVIVFSLLLALAAAFAVWTYFNNALSEQRLANDRILAENQKLDEALAEIDVLEQRREDIVSRMRVIQDLQGKRPLPVRVWDDVANAIPTAMYLTEFRRENDVFTFLGQADNPNIISSLVRNLDDSALLGNSKVVYFKQDVSAYDTTTATPNTSSSNNTSAEQDSQTYPEDGYIEFVVTTEVAVDAEVEEGEVIEDQDNLTSSSAESTPESQTSTGGE